MINFSLVIPCYNESANILVILKKYKNFLKDNNNELIIVNNGSTDNTDFLLRKYNKFKNLVTLKIKKKYWLRIWFEPRYKIFKRKKYYLCTCR